MATTEDVERIVAPVVASAGLELVDVELIPNPRVLRVSVDGQAGVDLDGLGPLARSISRLLDESEVVPGGHYDLEVSSPGLERPLRRPAHFARAVGSTVRIRTRAGGDAERRIEGLLVGADEHNVRIARSGGAGERSIAYAEIERARTVYDWRADLAADSAARPGRGRRAGREGPPAAAPSADAAPPRTTAPATGRERAATP